MRLLAIPSKSAFRIVSLKDPAEIERLLKASIYEALTELARNDDTLSKAQAESAARVDATPGTDSESVGRHVPKTKPGGKRGTGKLEN